MSGSFLCEADFIIANLRGKSMGFVLGITLILLGKYWNNQTREDYIYIAVCPEYLKL